MPSLTLPLTASGPVVVIAIFVSRPRRMALAAAGLPIPPPVLATMLVDTGASCTCVDPGRLKSLAIPPSGVAHVQSPTTGATPTTANQYDVDIAVVLDAANGRFHYVDTLPVIESHLAAQGIDGLLGRDVLSQGLLIFNGTAKTFTLSF